MNKILIYGAYGSLGRAITRHFYNKGLDLVLAGRDSEKLEKMEEFGEISSFNLESEVDSYLFKGANILIFATGLDIRKPLISQSLEEIDGQILSNLSGAVRLTRSFVSYSKEQSRKIEFQAIFLGGFGDGSWPTPYYSVDVATRAGLYSFIECMNIELKDSNIEFKYFSPLPADTPGERPYHNLWRSQGVKIVSSEEVAISIDKALKKRGNYIMGGLVLNLFYKLRHLFSRSFNRLIITPLGVKTMKYIDEMEN